MFVYLSIKNQSIFQLNYREITFNVISILTGTGYVTQNFSEWGSFPLMYFLILMFIGGCAGSNACGIKKVTKCLLICIQGKLLNS